jgi:hypothetical protein
LLVDAFEVGLGKYVENAIPDHADPSLQALELVAADYSPELEKLSRQHVVEWKSHHVYLCH